jgi:hypothetical protein
MNRFKITFAMLGLLAAGFAPSMRADDMDKETRLTTNQPLQVGSILLAPGQYVFRLIDRGVVSIYSADGAQLQGIILGWSAYREDAGDKQLFTVSQAQGNQPASLKYWFYPGEKSGLEFSAKKLEAGQVARSKNKGGATGAGDGASGTP